MLPSINNLESLSSVRFTINSNFGQLYTHIQALTAQDDATNTTLNSVSSLLTPLTLTNTLTGQLVTNIDFTNYQTNVTNTTSALLPTSIYQEASGNWQDAFTNVQSSSATWNTVSTNITANNVYLKDTSNTVGSVNFGSNVSKLAAPVINGQNDKITLWDFKGTGTGFNYAIGAEGNHVWFTMDVNNGTGGFKFYSRNNEIFKIRDDGSLLLKANQDILEAGTLNSLLLTTKNKADTTYTTVEQGSSNWYEASGAALAIANNFTQTNFFPLTGGIISGATRINNNLTVFGNLTATGTTTFANTTFSTTSSLSVVHVGSGPAMWVGNNGDGDIASFYDIDQNVEILHVGGNNGTFPNVGVKTSQPNKDFTVKGEISASNTIYDNTGNSIQWNEAYNISTNYQTASSSFATNTTLNSVSSLLTPLTLTNTLTSLLVTNTDFNTYKTNVASSTATLLPTTTYQNASGSFATNTTLNSVSSDVKNYVHTNFLPLTGGTITGNISAVGTHVFEASSVKAPVTVKQLNYDGYGTSVGLFGDMFDVIGGYYGSEQSYFAVTSACSIKEGLLTVASGLYSHAEGKGSIASGQSSHAEGTGSIASGESSHAENRNTLASGFAAHAEGFQTQAIGGYCHAEGSSTIAFDTASHAEGNNTKAYGFGSHAEGDTTTAYGNFSHAAGERTFAVGRGSYADGLETICLNNYGHAEGFRTSIGERVEFATSLSQVDKSIFTFTPLNSAKFNYIGDGSVGGYYIGIGGYYVPPSNISTTFVTVLSVLQRDTTTGTLTAQSIWNTIGGYQLISSGSYLVAGENGDYGHAEGQDTQAFGPTSHAEGYNTKASGQGSHAEGNYTRAGGYYSHAEGGSTQAIGGYSHSEGWQTQALGNVSHAAGRHSVANHHYTWIWKGADNNNLTYTTRTGQFMVSAEGGSAFFGNVGIGTDINSRALTVVGDISASGTIYGQGIGGGSGSTIDTGVRALTSNWQSTYTTFNTVSAPTIQIFTSSGTWTKPAGAVRVQAVLIGGGGGGGSGRSATTTVIRTGGVGGAGGAYQTTMLDAAILSSTVIVTVGLGGTGGSGVLNANGNSGNPGGATSFGAYSIANGGSGGPGGTASAQSGPAGGTLGGSGYGTSGGTGGATTTTDGGPGGDTVTSAPGGGAGGTVTAANARRRGGDGGICTSNGLARAAGALTTDPTPGNGANGSSVSALTRIPGQGGGGGCSQTATVGGAGGNGGLYGAGGGGGGGSIDTLTSGAGGNGADGIAAIITHYI